MTLPCCLDRFRRAQLMVLIVAFAAPGHQARAAAPAGGEASPVPDHARFALILGVNRSVDRNLPTLRYADDDAARYFDLFRSLGFRALVLTRADEDTRRLHVQSAGEATLPTKQSLGRAVERLASEIRQARKRGVSTTLYFVFAGHGNVRDGRGYLALEDARLTGSEIRARVLDPIGADVVHMIVDACNSYFVAHSRGPGGTRRPLRHFSRLKRAFGRQIGLLLSTTAAQESHEWEAFQAGVFSHEVRSGLYGAADADGDGRVSYREIGAFVDNASAAIPNARFRPRIFVQPPASGTTLLDLRSPSQRTIEIEEQHAGRYLLEDTRGVRLLDLHSGPGERVRLHRPAATKLLYLRRLTDEREYTVPPAARAVKLAALTPHRPRAARRGAAHHAFSMLFSVAFDRQVVTRYHMPGLSTQPLEAKALTARATRAARSALTTTDTAPAKMSSWRRVIGWSAIGLSGAALVAGVTMSVLAANQRGDVGDTTSQEDAVEINGRIDRYNRSAVVLYGVSGAALAGGLLALLWPDAAPASSLAFDGQRLFLRGSF